MRVVCDRCEKPVERHRTSDMTITARSILLPNGIIEWQAVLCQSCAADVRDFVNTVETARTEED